MEREENTQFCTVVTVEEEEEEVVVVVEPVMEMTECVSDVMEVN